MLNTLNLKAMENPFEQLSYQLSNILNTIEELKIKLDLQTEEILKTIQPAVEFDNPISIKEAAAYLNMSRTSVYQHLEKIPHKKRHGRLYFFRSQLKAYIEDGI